ncbi:MAG: hypothetical protein ACI4Q9_04035 [Candidatus Methanomethylophilaceae archaeon]
MANKYEWEDRSDGIAITRMVTTDRDVEIPDSIGGRAVTELCDRFLTCSASGDGRTVRVPASVKRFGREAFCGVTRISSVTIEGDVMDLFSSGMVAEYDFTLRFTYDGRERSFGFIAGYPISFPEFDTAILSSRFRIAPEIAMGRLSDPVMLSDDDRDRYGRYLRDMIVPMAERVVADNDPDRLRELYSAGVLDGDDMRSLLKRSVRSGRTAMTSVIMSMIRSMRPRSS